MNKQVSWSPSRLLPFPSPPSPPLPSCTSSSQNVTLTIMIELLEVWWRASLIRCFSVTTGILPWPLLNHVRVNRAGFFGFIWNVLWVVKELSFWEKVFIFLLVKPYSVPKGKSCNQWASNTLVSCVAVCKNVMANNLRACKWICERSYNWTVEKDMTEDMVDHGSIISIQTKI